MNMNNKEKLLKILKTGNFTIAYHDLGYCVIYKGHHEYDKLPKIELFESDNCCNDGYIPEIVELLVEALKGKVISI